MKLTRYRLIDHDSDFEQLPKGRIGKKNLIGSTITDVEIEGDTLGDVTIRTKTGRVLHLWPLEGIDVCELMDEQNRNDPGSAKLSR